jgi:soluble P-type ATPase
VKDSEPGVYYLRFFFLEELLKYVQYVTELYQYTAEQFKKKKDIIISLRLPYQKFSKLVDGITDLPRTDA